MTTVRLEASHLFGGEITWKCLPTGQFVFQVKVYRDCNGIPHSPYASLNVYGHPSVCNIPLNAAATVNNDISPPQCSNDCNSGGPGTTEEWIQESNPVFLSGVPPATGWVFEVNGCCRNTLNNVGGGGQSFSLRAIMYPYLGLNTNPCYDSSPFFAEKPNTFICVGYPFTYNPTAVDPERDSIVYSWDYPLQTPTNNPCQTYNGAIINFSAPYSVNSQLPGAPVLDSQSGEVTFHVPNAPTGNFATCIKVTAYKCGIKVAEIFRDYGVTLTAGCIVQGVAPNNINKPPTIQLLNPYTNVLTTFDTTIYVGDTLRYKFTGQDFQANLGGGLQQITISASGQQFGKDDTAKYSGCLIPPCAYLDKVSPSTVPILNVVNFTWPVECQHIEPASGCLSANNKYYFILKAEDDYCPAPAPSVATVTVTVLRPPKLPSPTLLGANVFGNGDVGLYWETPGGAGVRDTHYTFNQYSVYAALSAAGPWVLVDSIETLEGFYQKGDTVTATQLSLLGPGVNGQTDTIYFLVSTLSVCGDSSSVTFGVGGTLTSPASIIRSMYVNAANNGCGTTVSWNSMIGNNPPAALYDIWREYPAGVWTKIANQITGYTYDDSFTKTICTGNVGYKISTNIIFMSGILPMYSSIKSVIIDNNFVAAVAPANAVICPGQLANFSASPLNGACFTYSYNWSTGGSGSTTSTSTGGNHTVTITQNPSGCVSNAPYSVTVAPIPTASISGTASVCPGVATNLTINFTGTSPWNYIMAINGVAQASQSTSTNPLVIPVNPAATTTYTLNSVSSNCPGNVAGSATVTVWATPTIAISNTTNDTICTGSNSTVTLAFTGQPPFNYVYSINGVPSAPQVAAVSPVVLNVSPSLTTTYGLVSLTDGHNCTGTMAGTRKIVVIPTPTATLSVSGNDTICIGSGSTIKIDFTGTPPFVCNVRDNTTGLLTPVSTNLNSITLPVTPSSNTSYTILNFVSSTKNCPGTLSGSALIVVKPLPTANISVVGQAAICNGQAANLQVVFTGTGPYTFGLVTNAGAPVNTAAAASPHNLVVNPTATTNYIVTSVTDKFCTKTNINDTVNILVRPLPTAVLSGTTSICAGKSTTLTFTFTGTGPWSGNYTANGNPGGVFNTSTNPYSVTVSPSGTTTYALGAIVNDAYCQNSTNPATAIVTVNPLPTATISGAPTVCAGINTNLTVNFTTGTAPWTFYYHNTAGQTFGPITTSANPYNLPVNPTATTTYVLDSVFSTGCKGSVNGSALVTVHPLPTSVFTVASDTICAGGNTNLQIQFTGTGPFTYQLTGGAVQNATSNPQIINVSPVVLTNYQLATIADNTCSATVNQNVSVAVIQLPTATISTTTPSLCTGQAGSITINFTGQPPYSTTWSNGTVNTPVNSASNSITIPVNPTASATTYSLVGTVTGLYGCSAAVNPATALINVHPLPTATVSGNSTVCAGTATSFNINFTGTGPFNYTYSNGSTNTSGTTSNNPVTINVTPSSTTTYTPVAITDTYCTGTVLNGNAVVTVNPLPTASITGNDTICFGGNTSITINFTGTAPYNYSYSANGTSAGNFVANTNSVTIPIAPTTSTTYALGATVTDANTCVGNSSATTVYVKVTPTPSATLAGTTSICNGASTNLQLTLTGEAPYTYSYFAGATLMGPFTTNVNSLTIPVSPTSSTTYTLPATVVGNGCTGPANGNAVITVNQIPTATLSIIDDTVCAGNGTNLQIQFNGVAPFTYQFSGQPVQNASSNPYLIPVAPAATTTYTLTTVSDAFCSGQIGQSVLLKVLPNPTATITTTTPDICVNDNGSLTVNFTGVGPFATTYTTNGTNSFPVTSSTTSSVIPVTPVQSTTYTLTGVVTSLYGCNSPVVSSTAITVHDLPTAAISGNPVICYGDQTSISISFTGVAPFNYTYLNNLSGQSASGTTNSNPVVIPVSPLATTNYTVTATSDAHCLATQLTGLANVIVNPLPTPVITGVNEVCDGITSTLSTTLPYVIYNWSTTASTSSIVVSDDDDYTVTVTDVNGCVNTSPVFHFTVNPVPVVDFTNDTSKTCEIPLIHFTNLSTYQPGAEFHWNLSDSATSTDVNPSHVYSLPNTYQIQLVVVNPTGCKDSLTKDVDVIFYPLAEAEFAANPTVTNIFSSSVNFIDKSKNAVKWTWYFGDGATSNQQNPQHYYPEIGEYVVKLIVENISGCPDETQTEIVINPFYLPNAFSPNGDGANDNFFNPGFSLDVQSFNLKIFNRWGQKFFEATDFTDTWNGNDGHGSNAPQGTYVYSLSITAHNGKNYQYNGTVTLVR